MTSVAAKAVFLTRAQRNDCIVVGTSPFKAQLSKRVSERTGNSIACFGTVLLLYIEVRMEYASKI
jgi:hypothetical protein